MADPKPSGTLEERMACIRHIVLVLSGKGGVGKSTTTVNLAQSLVMRGQKVGILDIDICGPSIPTLLGLVGSEVVQSSDGWVPVYANREQTLGVMSIGFLLRDRDDAVVWRGPKKTAMIKQFLGDVYWGHLDYLIVDTPPGTSDEHIAVMEALSTCAPDGAVVVTTPQGVSVNDVRKELNFCAKTRLRVLGIVENMSGFVCPHCAECTPIFLSGGGERLAAEQNVDFLGRIPIEPRCVSVALGSLDLFRDSATAAAINAIVDKVVAKVEPPAQ